MNELTYQLLQELAERLGTTTEYLWQALVNQAPISSLTNIAIYIMLIALIGLIARCSKGLTFDEVDDPKVMVFLIFGLIWLILGTIFFMVSIHDTVTGLFNPEYWALQQILEFIK